MRIPSGWCSTRLPAPATVVGLVDLGDRFRLVANVIEVVPPDEPLPNLPVARAVWKPAPSLSTSAELWLTAGGPHHTVLTGDVGPETLQRLRADGAHRAVDDRRGQHPAGLRRPCPLEPGLLPAGRGPAGPALTNPRWRDHEAGTAGHHGREHRARHGPRGLWVEREDRRPGPRSRGERAAAAGSLVGVTMPTKSSERWIHDGDNIKAALEKLGYKVDLQYAENDIPTQVNQIENQITKGAKLLVIASIDGTAITTQLQEAADKKIPVIAYDRLIRNSPNVDYYATFDNFKVGVEQATSLLVGLGLKKEDGSDGTATGPFNIELFAGSPDDNNATFFFNGAMSVLKPLHGQGHAGGQERADRLQARSRSCGGTRRPPSGAWRTCSPRRTAAAPRSTACCRRTTACRSASCRR